MTCDCGQPFISFRNEETTLVGFYSHDGHVHDDNCLGRSYRCVDGHDTYIFLRRTCPLKGCQWKGQQFCFCHKGEKVDEWPEVSVHDYANS